MSAVSPREPAMDGRLAARSLAVEWSGIRIMFALADEIPGVVNLGIGQPDFDTPDFIREAAKEALDQGYTRYPPARGFLDLRESYVMTGWRVGHVTGPRFIIDEMEKLMEHQVSGVTALAQRAALAAITGPQDCVGQMVDEYERRRVLVHQGLNKIDGISCIEPQGAFYAFPNIADLELSSWDLARYLVREHKVALVPGSIFGQNGEGYLRLSLGASEAELREGLALIAAGADELRKRTDTTRRASDA